MRRVKLVLAALLAVSAVGALVASSAFAKPEFLDNVAGNTFSGEGGKGELTTLSGGVSIACKKNSVKGEITNNEEGKITGLDFTECTALGLFSANSLGDSSGTILAATATAPLPFKLCYINEANKEVGIIIESVNSHIEVPAAGKLINVSGSIIGVVLADSINSLKTTPFHLKFTQSAAGDQNFVKCTLLGTVHNASLIASQDELHKENESAAITAEEETLTFAKDVQIDA